MSSVIKGSMYSVLGVFGAANYFRGLNQQELKLSKLQRNKRMLASPQYKNGKFINQMPRTPYNKNLFSDLNKATFGRAKFKPQNELPVYKINHDLLNNRSEELRVTWLGHSSLFIEMNATRFLLDPVFEFASPLIAKPFFDRNISAPVAKNELPLPDVIVISHDHYDHLEKSTIQYFADKPLQFLVPLGVGQHLENWGVKPSKIQEFDWWESSLINGVKLTSTPANHNSGRTGVDCYKTLWCSWALQSENGSVFFSGDTAYDSHFSAIQKTLGHFDMAFMEVAANVKDGVGFPVENHGHMQACHTVRAFKDLKATKLFPIHWATFELFTHMWDEPMVDLIQEAGVADVSLTTPMIGQTIYPKQEFETSYWWWQAEKAHVVDMLKAIDTELNVGTVNL